MLKWITNLFKKEDLPIIPLGMFEVGDVVFFKGEMKKSPMQTMMTIIGKKFDDDNNCYKYDVVYFDFEGIARILQNVPEKSISLYNK